MLSSCAPHAHLPDVSGLARDSEHSLDVPGPAKAHTDAAFFKAQNCLLEWNQSGVLATQAQATTIGISVTPF